MGHYPLCPGCQHATISSEEDGSVSVACAVWGERGPAVVVSCSSRLAVPPDPIPSREPAPFRARREEA